MGAVITLTTDFGMADAYVAARLSLGFPPADFGEAVTSVTMLPLPQPYRASDSSLVGHILHIDSFGNLITNIQGDDLHQTGQAITIEVGNQFISGLSHTYAEGEGLLALVGSSGYLDVSLKGAVPKPSLMPRQVTR